MNTIASILAALPETERRKALATLPAADLAALEYAWPVWARPNQLPPPRLREGYPDWRNWLICSGRGFGKSKAAAETVRAEIEGDRRRSVVLLSPTADTGRRDVIAAILACSPPWAMPTYEASQRRLLYASGAICHNVSCEEPERLRGLNADYYWWDELCASANQEAVFSNLQLALRVPGPKGDAPCGIITTTPKRSKLLRAIMDDPSTVTTRGSTFENRANLDPATLLYLETKYAGSTLGRQELEGHLLDDTESALWRRAMLDETRVQVLPEMRRIVVAIDPAGSSNATSDETGIIACGLGRDGRGYVLADASGKYTPDGWARAAVNLYRSVAADRIVAEVNFGGNMVEATIRAVDPLVPVKTLHASRGKAIRAEPISALYEQRRVSHVGFFPALEDQMCGWAPGDSDSPDRVDALVWAMIELMGEKQSAPARYIDFNFMAR